MEPIVFVGRLAGGIGQFRAAFECVCCGQRWLERAPSPDLMPRFRLARVPASSLPMELETATDLGMRAAAAHGSIAVPAPTSSEPRHALRSRA